jgi:hypothetical protein
MVVLSRKYLTRLNIKYPASNKPRASQNCVIALKLVPSNPNFILSYCDKNLK